MTTKFADLPIDERIELVGDLWDSIVADQGALDLTDEQRTELDRRLDAFSESPQRGRMLEEVLKGLRKRL